MLAKIEIGYSNSEFRLKSIEILVTKFMFSQF